jgi:DNA polymerase III epsilon subunit-like protein
MKSLAPALSALLASALVCSPVAFATDPVTNAALRVSDALFVAFDTETTGLSADRDRILEIGAVKFRHGKELARQRWLISPGIPLPEEAQRINGITPEMVSNAPPFREVYPQFAAFIGDGVLLAHNARFDRRFLAAEIRRNDLAMATNIVLDTLRLFHGWFPNAPRYSLESLVLFAGVSSDPPSPRVAPVGATNDPRSARYHSALKDASCLMDLFLRGATNLPTDATLDTVSKAAGGPLTLETPRDRKLRR